MSLKTEDEAVPPPEPKAELVITLRKPVTVGGIETKSVRLREPLAGEYRDFMRQQGVKRTLSAVSLIGGVPMAVALQIGARDLGAAQTYIDVFVETGADPADEGLEELVLPLPKPIEHDGEGYTSLSLREPTGADLIEIYSKVGVDQTIVGVARISGAPIEVVEKIPVRVLNRAEAFLAGFINGGQTAGAGS